MVKHRIKRVLREFTPEEKARWEAGVREELAGKAENIAHIQKLLVAREDDSLSGELRRIIGGSGLTRYRIAKDAGISQSTLEYFMTGERSLRLETVDKLAKVLGLRLSRRKRSAPAAAGSKTGEGGRRTRRD